MPHVPTLYLDTSVIGGYFDEEWREPTRNLWRLMELGCVRFVTSEVTADELVDAPLRVRELFDRTFSDRDILFSTAETTALAAAYVRHGVLTAKYSNDAQHVAICTVAGIQRLASWNFKHFVNPERKKGFSTINRLKGYPSVGIVTPKEFIDDHQET